MVTLAILTQYALKNEHARECTTASYISLLVPEHFGPGEFLFYLKTKHAFRPQIFSYVINIFLFILIMYIFSYYCFLSII